MRIGFKETSAVLIEVPQEIPEALPFVLDDCSFAFSLHMRNKILWHLIINKKKYYDVFKLRKPRGGHRIVHAPNYEILKSAHSAILVKYLVPLQEELGPHVTAYRNGRSIKDAIVQHIPDCPICDGGPPTPPSHDCPRNGLFLKMDLKDFFSSTRRSWIRQYFQTKGYNFDVAGLLANLLTVSDLPNPWRHTSKDQPRFVAGVPQGASTSGAICNLVADWRIDQPILKFLKEHGIQYNTQWVYTRYSDDLTFTCDRTFSPPETSQFIRKITKIINQGGYQIHLGKTKMEYGSASKKLLGAVINQKPNISALEYRRLRAIIHNCLVMGFETQYKRAGKKNAKELIRYLQGKVNFIGQISEQKGSKLKVDLDCAISKWPIKQKMENS